MCHRFPVASIFFFTVLLASGYGQEPLRLATWNIQATGTSSSTQWSRALAVIGRANADVVALQEITDASEVATLSTFAAAAGYPYFAVSTTSGTLSGSLYNGAVSRFPIVFSNSYSSAEISGDPTANDITRDIFEMHVQVPNAADVTAFFIMHLKSGAGSANEFRRAVELKRLGQVITNFQSAHPSATYVVCGDFNEDIGDGPFGNAFNTVPSGMPTTFDLGNDVTFPVVYDPFIVLTSTGLVIAPATQEDSTTLFITRSSSSRRLDYIFYSSGISLVADEVYNSARDDGFDDAPVGNWLTKAGSALPSSYSLDASDHFLVFADVTVPSQPVLVYPGSNEDFVLLTGVNAAPTGGSGEDVKPATPGQLLFVNFSSPSGTFDLTPPLLVGQLFSTGFPPVGALPGLWVNTSGAAILVNGLDPGILGLSTVVIPGTGNTYAYLIPSGLAGYSVILQALAVSPFASNGFFAITDGHEIQMQP